MDKEATIDSGEHGIQCKRNGTTLTKREMRQRVQSIRFRVLNLQFAVIVNIVFRTRIDSIVYFHNGGLIATSVAIVWCRKDSDNRSIVLPLVSLHD